MAARTSSSALSRSASPALAALKISEPRFCCLLVRRVRLAAVAGGNVGGPVLDDRSLERGARGEHFLPHTGHVASAGIAHFERPPDWRRRIGRQLQRRGHGLGLAWTVTLATRERPC
jgi:hypothetical protein